MQEKLSAAETVRMNEVNALYAQESGEAFTPVHVPAEAAAPIVQTQDAPPPVVEIPPVVVQPTVQNQEVVGDRPDFMIPKTRFDEATGKLKAQVSEYEGRFVEANQALTHTNQELAVAKRKLAELEANPALKAQQQQNAVDAELNRLGLDVEHEGNRQLVSEILTQRATLASVVEHQKKTVADANVQRLWGEWDTTVKANPKLAQAVAADPEYAQRLSGQFANAFQASGGTLDFNNFAQQEAKYAPVFQAAAPTTQTQAPALMPQPGINAGVANQSASKSPQQIATERFRAAKTPAEQAAIMQASYDEALRA